VRVRSLGHVVLKVRDLERSEAFYADTLGIPVVSRISEPVRMTFFTLGNHHDFAIIEIGKDAPPADPRAPGLAHVAFNIGDSSDEFVSMQSHLEAAGVETLYVAERSFATSLHLLDPDGHEVELYIDVSPDGDPRPAGRSDTVPVAT
jgi:catechol-2,3-dioxygenase